MGPFFMEMCSLATSPVNSFTFFPLHCKSGKGKGGAQSVLSAKEFSFVCGTFNFDVDRGNARVNIREYRVCQGFRQSLT